MSVVYPKLAVIGCGLIGSSVIRAARASGAVSEVVVYDASPAHRDRMRLILSTPALQAHAVLRYEQWRAVIAEYVAEQTGQEPTSFLPRLVGHVSLALAMDAYERWLGVEDGDAAHDKAHLLGLLDQTMRDLRAYLA